MEVSLVKAFSWNLYSLDQTDIETLLPFVFRWSEKETSGSPKKNGQGKKRLYADQVNWLP
jgi:hypothetical protein